MTGFRSTAHRTAHQLASRTKGRADTGADAPSTSQRIIEGLTSGCTPRMVARQLGLPLDLVLMVIERARARGELDFFELRTANCSSGAACQPDPDSLVCAGCPLLPERTLAARRGRTTISARIQRAFTRH